MQLPTAWQGNATPYAVIRTFHRSADDRDFRAITRGKGSFGRNLLLASVPIALFLSALVYVVWRSLIAASMVGVLGFVICAACASLSLSWFNLLDGFVSRRDIPPAINY
jgi:hypothetical protein